MVGIVPNRDPRAGKTLMTPDTVNTFLPRISLILAVPYTALVTGSGLDVD